MTEVKVPALAESISEVTLSRWLVKEGDYVTLDQPLCEMETDKASQELPSPAAGVIKFVAKEGDDVPVGGLLCTIDETAAKPADSEKPVVEKAAPKTEVKKEEPKKETTDRKSVV